MKRLAGLVLLLALVTGCSGGSPISIRTPGAADTPVATRLSVDDLADLSTEYLGNASAVITVLNGIYVPEMGEYTIALATEQMPYGLEIRFSKLGTYDSEPALLRRATDTSAIFLALTSNADWVTWRFPSGTLSAADLSVTRADASAFVGEDIKELGKSQAGLAELRRALLDAPYPS